MEQVLLMLWINRYRNLLRLSNEIGFDPFLKNRNLEMVSQTSSNGKLYIVILAISGTFRQRKFASI